MRQVSNTSNNGKAAHLSVKRASYQLASATLKNGSSSLEHELEEALEAAQRAGVTELELMYARLLMEAGIPIEDWPDDEAGDDQC